MQYEDAAFFFKPCRPPMKYSDQTSLQLITKLTAIWALSESGLGGIFHALKLPFSGIFLGGFAVIIITFIAKNSSRKFFHITQATFIVILIKAIASPHSPITAYIAVLFQGLLGAVIYGIFKPRLLVAIFFGVLALMESALQKLLVLTLLFGENIWEAFQEFFKGVSSKLHFEQLALLPEAILATYLFLYFCGGILAGWFAIKIPTLIKKEAENLQNFNREIPDSNALSKSIKKKSPTKWLLMLFILLFIMSVSILSGSAERAIHSLIRTFAALFILFFVLNPLFKYLLLRWKEKQTKNKSTQLKAVLHFLPEFKDNAKTAEQIARQESNVFRKAKKFLTVWMAISLYNEV